CTHNKASLSQGKLNAFEEIICPWHEYRFNLKTGRECAGRSADLQTWQTEKKEDGLYLLW
ncbi:MAG: Rieske 2Fe-2S domain-containing protein, partial [Flammeovirgaceae bacterium]|nr:Rieske 2Fe-2S domain-containing protein [Flammeovirgaceae bacterium]